ncbi:MAG: hypothetical protein ACK5NY_01225 [Burkholderiaceae bacterium]|jgi:opacity protein-like surface antigen
MAIDSFSSFRAFRSHAVTGGLHTLLIGMLALGCAQANAQQNGKELKMSDSLGYVAARAGTPGLGFDLAYGIGNGLYVRGNINGFSYSTNVSQSDVDYKAKVKLQTAGILLDWHPFETGFRLTGGMYYNGNRIDLTGKPTVGKYNLNGRAYVATDIGSLDGSLRFRSSVPYVGLGYHQSNGDFSLIGDAGVMFMGSARAKLDVTCGPNLQANPLLCAQAQQDAAREADKARDMVDSWKYYPVLSVGMGYRF